MYKNRDNTLVFIMLTICTALLTVALCTNFARLNATGAKLDEAKEQLDRVDKQTKEMWLEYHQQVQLLKDLNEARKKKGQHYVR